MTLRCLIPMFRGSRLRDDEGSMALALLAVVITMLVGGLMLPMLVTQDRSSRFDTTRVHSLDSAQTGIDVVLGQIRAATRTDRNGNVWGDAGSLPCGPISGSANGTSGGGDAASAGTYSVSIAYYTADPSTASKMLCAPGYGPYDPTTQSRTPRFARISSTGTDGPPGNGGSAGRTVVTTYVFQTDDANIPGGIIRLFPDSSGGKWCMDAGSATPAANTPVQLATCSSSTPPAAQQVFAYRQDLSIQLVSSVTDANPAGMCLDTASTPHAAGVGIVLKTCAVADVTRCSDITACSPWNQQWSVNDNAHIEGAKSDRSDPTKQFKDGFCIDAASQSAVPLTLQPCAGSTQDSRQTWIPSPTTGAGMAGATYGQEVDFGQFGTCLDVTGQNPDSTYLIMYTCKQDPNPAQVTWNQVFKPSPALGTGPTHVLLKTIDNNGGGGYPNPTTFCLLSPGTAGGYVRVVTPCPASPTGLYDWTVYTLQDGSGNDLPYKEKYQIVDSTGLCLAPGPNGDLYLGQYLKVVTAQCDGSTAQKWNANPSLDAARLTNSHEP
jgi:hypothetical protein